MAKFKISEEEFERYKEGSNKNPGTTTFKISKEEFEKYKAPPIRKAKDTQIHTVNKAADTDIPKASTKQQTGGLSAYEAAVKTAYANESGNYNPQTGINEGWGEVTPGSKPISSAAGLIYKKIVNPLAEKAYGLYEKLDDYAVNENDLNRIKAAADAQGEGQAVNDESLRLNRILNERKNLLSGMTDEQKNIYDSLPEWQRKDYLDSIEDELNQKAGLKEAEYISGEGRGTASPAGYAFAAGGNNFGSGLKGAVNLLRGKEGETAAKAPIEYTYGAIAPNLKGGEKVLSDIAYTTGNMAPSMAVGLLSGGLGTAAMGISSAGNSYDEAIREGYTPEKAAAYGISSGIKEAALQRVAGALPGVSNAQSVLTKALGKYGHKAAEAVIKNDALRTSLEKIAGSALSEGSEEYVQELLDPILKNIFLGEDNEVKAFAPEALYAGALGAISGGMFEVPGAIKTGVEVKSGTNVNGNTDSKGFKKAGKTTTIYNPYDGITPLENNDAQYTRVSLNDNSFNDAVARTETAKAVADSGKKSFKRALKDIYTDIFGEARSVRVKNINYNGEAYNVALNKGLVGKVISDPNVSLEKLAVLDNLDTVVAEGRYVGSGKYIPKGNKIKNTIRFDYFETDININGKPYVAVFDVEVIPGKNNYRTHKVINEINLTSSADGEAGPEPAASTDVSGFSNNSINPENDTVNRYYAPENKNDTTNLGKNIINETEAESRLNTDTSEAEVKETEEKRIMRSKALRAVNPNSPDAQNIYRGIMRNYGYGDMVSKMDAIAKKLGSEVQFYADNTKSEGYNENNVIHLNVNNLRSTADGVWKVFKHELTHSLEGTNAYGELLRSKAGAELFNEFLKKGGYTVTDAEGNTTTSVEVLKNEIRELYAKNNVELSPEQLNHECIAKFIEQSDILTSEESIQRLAEGSPNFALRIYNWIKDTIAKFGASPETKMLMEAERLYAKALRQAEKGQYNRDGGKAYAIERTVNNEPVVVIDEDILSNVPKNEWEKVVKDNLIKKFKNGIKAGSNIIKVNQQSRKEYVRSKESKSLYNVKPDIYADKMRASNNIDEITTSTRDYVSEKPKHERDDNIYDFGRANIKIRVGSNDYNADVIVGTKNNGDMIFYDVVNLTPTEFTMKKQTNRMTAFNQKNDIAEVDLSVDNSITENGRNGNKEFSFSEPVEETKTLVALHNLSEDKLKKALQLGGFPMPSIAVTRYDIPHTNFGDITLVMNKNTIDPKANKKNTVYSADAWTPTFPQIEYEANEKVRKKISDKYYDLGRRLGYDAVRPLYDYVYDAERQLQNNGGEQGIIDSLKDNTDMMNVYLADSGKEQIKPISKEVVTRLSDEKIELYEYLIDSLGEDAVNEVTTIRADSPIARRKAWVAKHGENLIAAYKSYLRDVLGIEESGIENVLADPAYSPARLSIEVVNANRYLKNGAETTRTEYDGTATKEAIRKATDKKAYEKWLTDLFTGLEKGTGIYNNKEIYTPSGNRRSFAQTHYPVTLQNIVKAMAGQNDGNTKNVSGFYGIKSLRAGTAERFKSIADMHKMEGRLQHLTEEEASAISDALSKRLNDIIGKVIRTKHGSKYENDFMMMDSVGSILVEIGDSGKYTVDNIEKIFAQYQYNISNNLAADIRDLLFDTSQMPVNIFEAKPERAVGFDEVLAAVVPDTTDSAFVEELKQAGLNVLTYKQDDVDSRIDAVNSVEGASFSFSDEPNRNTFNKKSEQYLRRATNTLLNEFLEITGADGFTDKNSLKADINSFAQESAANGKTDRAEGEKLFDMLYNGAENNRKAYADAKNEFMASLNKFEQGINDVIRYTRSKEAAAGQRAGVKAERADKANTILTDKAYAKQFYKDFKQAKRTYDKLADKEMLTAEDTSIMRQLSNGTVTMDDVEKRADEFNVDAIKRVYDAFKAKTEFEKVQGQLRKSAVGRNRELAKERIANSDSWQDKKAGALYKREIMERNIEDITKGANGKNRRNDDAVNINKTYFKPIHENEAKSNRLKNELVERVKSLKLGTKGMYTVMIENDITGMPMQEKVSESGLVQLYGEGIIDDATLDSLNVDKEKIHNAVKEFRDIYNQLLDMANETLIRNGYEPVEYRKNYFPHFTENKADSVLGEIAGYFGIDINADELPTDIAGITHTFRPGKRWVGNFLERKTNVTDYDALKGFDRYLNGAADVIFHTDDIQRLRALETELRYKYSNEGTRERLREIEDNPALTTEQKQSLIEDILKANKMSHLPHLVTELRNYTDNLAGKKSISDRNWEHTLGRGFYSFMKKMENRVSANMVALNPASWLTNFIPITQVSGIVDSRNLTRAIWDTTKSYAKSDGFSDRSDFLVNRRGSDMTYKTTVDKVQDRLTKPFEIIDNFTADVVTRALYYDQMAKVQNEAEALEYANDMAARIMADRSKGAQPTIFNKQSPVAKLFTMFQVEVNNQYSYMFKDVPAEIRKDGLGKLAAAFFKMFLGAFLYNEVYEKIVGRRAAFDPVDIAASAVGDFTNPDVKKSQAIANMALNAVDELPFVGGLLGGGRVPMSSALPDIGNLNESVTGLLTGEMNDKKAMQQLGKELIKPAAYLIPPVGGGQTKKTIEGLWTMAKGEDYTYDSDGNKRLKYAIDKSDPVKTAGKYVQAAIFGKSALPEAQEYYGNSYATLSAKQTQNYYKAVEAGITYKQYMTALGATKGLESDKDKDGNTIALSLARKKKAAIDKAVEDYGLTKKQKEILYEANGVSESVW